MSQEAKLWIGLVEVKPLDPKDFGAAGAFTNIVTWARDHAEFRQKAETIAATLNLYVIGVEGEESLEERLKAGSVDEEIEDMARRAEANLHAIVYGTFHTYPFNQA